MCVFSSHSFWTSSSLDVPAGVTQEEGHTGFLIHLLSAVRALIFLARRIQPFLSLVDREVEFCVLTIKSFSTRWALLFLFFSFLVRKIPFAGIELKSQRVRGLRDTSERPGRPAVCVCVFSSHPFWTSSSLDVPAGVTQEEGHTGFLIHLPSAVRALIFVARRIQPFLSLVDREVEFCVLTN